MRRRSPFPQDSHNVFHRSTLYQIATKPAPDGLRDVRFDITVAVRVVGGMHPAELVEEMKRGALSCREPEAHALDRIERQRFVDCLQEPFDARSSEGRNADGTGLNDGTEILSQAAMDGFPVDAAGGQAVRFIENEDLRCVGDANLG